MRSDAAVPGPSGAPRPAAPAPLACVAIPLGMGLLGALSVHLRSQRAVATRLGVAPEQVATAARRLLLGSVIAHVVQAEVAARWAQGKGWPAVEVRRARRRTWVLGFPALRAVRRAPTLVPQLSRSPSA